MNEGTSLLVGFSICFFSFTANGTWIVTEARAVLYVTALSPLHTGNRWSEAHISEQSKDVAKKLNLVDTLFLRELRIKLSKTVAFGTVAIRPRDQRNKEDGYGAIDRRVAKN